MPKPRPSYNDLYVEFRNETDAVKKFNLFIEMFCPEEYAHLIDSDENAGEFMREAILLYGDTEKEKLLRDLSDVGEIHHSVLDYRLEQIEEDKERRLV